MQSPGAPLRSGQLPEAGMITVTPRIVAPDAYSRASWMLLRLIRCRHQFQGAPDDRGGVGQIC